jgi:PAS domain S-box-containing protein
MVTQLESAGFSLDDLRDVVFHTDADGRWTYLNSAWKEITGFAVAESLGRLFLDFVHPDDRKRNLDLFEPLIRRQKDHCFHEIRYLTRGGDFKWVEVHARLTLASDGSATGTTGTLRDVTARREAEATQRRLHETLQETEARFQAMANGAPVILWMSSAQGENQFVNHTYEEFFGVKPGDANGFKWTPLIHPADAVGYLSAVEDAVREHKGYSGEVRALRRDGSWRWFACHAQPRLSASGEFLGHVGIALDISDRKASEDALRESEERYRSSEAKLRIAMAAARQVEWEYDAEQDRWSVGPEWEEVTGLAGVEVASAKEWYRAIHPEDYPAAKSALRSALEIGGNRVGTEYRVRSADGTWRWIRASGRVTQCNEARKPLFVSGVMMDVTEIHSLQESLIAASRLASVGTLAAGVAHEINNPLAWVKNNLGYALECVPPAPTMRVDTKVDWAELRAALEEAHDGVRRIADIVRAMRSLGRPVDASQPDDVDLRAEVLSAVQMVRTQVLQRAQLHVDLPADLPPVRANNSELGRVFLNLILNAAQAIPEGDQALNLVSVRGGVEGSYVFVEVTDSGLGIEPNIRDRIFDPFFTTKPPGVGTGLGLTMVRSIVNSTGGRVVVESAPGQGATFRVVLPASPAHAATRPPAPAAPTQTATARPARCRVLIVDDEPLLGRSIERWLDRRHEVTVLTSGAEALRLIEQGARWDVVLCDFTMPDLDGIALYEAVLARAPALAQRWSFITGGIVSERTASFLVERAVPILHKPVEPPALFELIDRLARRTSTAAPR